MCRSADKRCQFIVARDLRCFLLRALLAVLPALGAEHFLRAACQYQLFPLRAAAMTRADSLTERLPWQTSPRGCRRSPQFFVSMIRMANVWRHGTSTPSPPHSNLLRLNSAAKVAFPLKSVTHCLFTSFAPSLKNRHSPSGQPDTLRICNLCVEYDALASTASNRSCIRRKVCATLPQAAAQRTTGARF